MGEDWGPWIPCDGTGVPVRIAHGQNFLARIAFPGITPGDNAGIHAAVWPGFFWRWTRVRTGFLRWERRRVCHVPAYAPIIAIRLRKPPAREASTEASVALLRRIAAFKVTPAREDA